MKCVPYGLSIGIFGETPQLVQALKFVYWPLLFIWDNNFSKYYKQFLWVSLSLYSSELWLVDNYLGDLLGVLQANVYLPPLIVPIKFVWRDLSLLKSTQAGLCPFEIELNCTFCLLFSIWRIKFLSKLVWRETL